MKVERVSATIKYSQDTGHGAWKAVEIGAEASVDDCEGWSQALAHLYGDLGQQLKTLWANGTGQNAQTRAEEPTEAASEPEPPQQVPTQPPAHFCQEHQTPFKQYHRGDNVWNSHKTGPGKGAGESDQPSQKRYRKPPVYAGGYLVTTVPKTIQIRWLKGQPLLEQDQSCCRRLRARSLHSVLVLLSAGGCRAGLQPLREGVSRQLRLAVGCL